jgi:hypothetical protein
MRKYLRHLTRRALEPRGRVASVERFDELSYEAIKTVRVP